MNPHPLPPFVLVTGNRGKLEETRRLLGRKVENAAVDLPEIQSLDLVEVLEAKAAEAFRRLGRPLVVEETGLALIAMGGFPGPLVKWMLEAMGPEGIARTAAALGDTRAMAHCALLWTDGKTSVLGRGETSGTLVLPPRGSRGFGWDPIFQPDGHDQTYAELGDEIKDTLGHRGRAWRDLLRRLSAK
jgi:non-canonical purine NTP pyrophosphatase (RdgB/HAM1 family)